eukprot:280555-Pyramimonas_sp.AAC.1
MGVPSLIQCFYRMLYTSNLGMITSGGRRFNSFPIKRGARQGDPSSMTLLCLCLDPVLRWLQYKLPRQLDLTLACADD